MADFFFEHETAIRLGSFLGSLAAMGLGEAIAPRRRLTIPKAWRWASNLGLVTLNTLLLRLLFPAATVGMALSAEARAWGLLNNIEVSPWFAAAISVIALDLVIYLQHVMFHAVPALWRLHRVHHADLDFDVTTGIRFHPIEILLSMLLKLAAVVVLGTPAVAVLIFEVVLNTMAMFNHSNVRLPLAVDAALRRILVTPDMHRVHHSIEGHEANSNFGFNLSLWDRLFGTYLHAPSAGHEKMTLGIRDFRDPKQVERLTGMLWLPFLGQVKDYAINCPR
jgi:sterol desaturase/sphingolipid hydroxylase (fatty acid hydroxylase superfamily)